MPAARALLRPPPRSDVLLAVAWFALGALFYVAGLEDIVSGAHERAPLWERLVVLAVGCVLVSYRRRAPLLALAVAVPVVLADAGLGGPGLPVLLVLIESLYNATLRAPRPWSRAVAGAAVAATVVLTALAGVASGDWRVSVPVVLQTGAALLIPVWWAMEVRRHRELARMEKRNAVQQARIAALDRRAAVAAERARMARDLHDVIAGHLSAIALQSEAVLSMADGDPATARRVLASIRENSVQSLAEMRAMIDLLRAEDPDPHTAPSGLADLDRLLDSARAGGLDVTARTDLDATLPAVVDLAAYRILQESLTNAARHAPGSRVQVTARAEEDTLLVEVTNDLTGTSDPAEFGADPASGDPARADDDRAKAGGELTRAGGTGLTSMRERADGLGGSLTAGPEGDTWRVRAVLPMGPAGARNRVGRVDAPADPLTTSSSPRE